MLPISSLLLERLAGLGINVAKLLERSGLHANRFSPRRAILTKREFVRFFRSIEEIAPSPGVGLRLGSNASPHQLDLASLAALHSPNLGTALQMLARYARLVCAGDVDIALKKGEARIGYHWVDPSEKPPSLFIDFVFASALEIARRGCGRHLKPLRVELVRRRTCEAALKGNFECEIAFDAPLDVLVFDESVLAQPFVTRNDDLVAVLSDALEEALNDILASRSVADDVRSILRHHMDGQGLCIEKIAEKMHMSSRTLQRRLGELGTSYQKLLDEVRRETARRLLSATDLDAGQIALLLGFEEANSFARAFHAWEGATPARWRVHSPQLVSRGL